MVGESATTLGNTDIAVARLNPDGSFDTNFGIGGKVVTDLDGRNDYGKAVIVQSDGKIVVAGYSNRPTTGDDFVIIRYTSDGILDTTFNGSGIVITDILTNRTDRASSLALESGGKIVVAGYTNNVTSGNNFAIARYNTDGSLDSTFNATGKVSSDLNSNSNDIGNAVRLQSDGKIVVAGSSNSDFGLARFKQNGSLDNTFGSNDNGIVITDVGTNSNDIGRGLVIQNNGKITIAGKSRTELTLAQYNSDGTVDTFFGKNGFLVQNAGNNVSSGSGGYFGIEVQNDGRFVAIGEGWRDGFGIEFVVSRINSDGTFDFSLDGGDGIASTDINGRFDEGTGIAIQPDGKLVVGGRAQNSSGGYDFAVIRYNFSNGYFLDASFGNNGIVITDIQGHPDEGADAIVIQTDWKNSNRRTN